MHPVIRLGLVITGRKKYPRLINKNPHQFVRYYHLRANRISRARLSDATRQSGAERFVWNNASMMNQTVSQYPSLPKTIFMDRTEV